MTLKINPTDLAHHRANVRGHERDRRGHGAATDPEALAAYRQATAERRAVTASTAVRVTRQPRGFTLADHEHAEELRREAARLAEIAAAKDVPEQRRLVEREVAQLEARAEAIVPLEHARAGWR